MVRTVFIVFLLATKSHAQSVAAIPQADAGHGSQASCVILKRMRRVDQVTSHLYSFGIRAKPFRYIEGKLPEGFPSHGKMTDDDVRNLQDRGTEVIVLESHYTSEDLKQARADCRGDGGKTPNQAERKPPPTQAPGAIGSTPTRTLEVDDSASSVDTTEAALIDVSSIPAGADVYIDEHFFGRTPATMLLRPGDHEIAIEKSGFIVWQKKIKLSSGHTNVDAELVPKAK
jgi:hypothetical protein